MRTTWTMDEALEDLRAALEFFDKVQSATADEKIADCGHTVDMRHYVWEGELKIKTVRTDVGGWPGYHTHWTPLELPEPPDPAQDAEPRRGICA